MPKSAPDSSSPSPSPAPRAPFPVSRGLLYSEQSKRWVKKYRTEVASSSSSLLSTIAAFPLDSVKTRMQAYKFDSFADCVKHTYRTEGVHGFWRGVWSPLASVTLVRTVSFSIYQRAKYTYDDWIFRATGSSPLVVANKEGAWPTLSTITCFGAAGATAGAVITAVACPFELTKLSAQISVLMNDRSRSTGDGPHLQARYEPAGTIRTARQLIKHRGVSGLYSGFGFHLLRDTIGTGIYFMSYESVKQLLANARGHSPTSPTAVIVAGGLCGLVSWACIYPIDSAKSIYQRNCLTSHKDHTKIPKIQFFNRRMYRGLGVSMGRSCVLNAIFFSAFEAMKKQVNRLEVDEQVLAAARNHA